MTTLTTPYWPTRDLPVNGHQPIHPINLAQWTEPAAETSADRPSRWALIRAVGPLVLVNGLAVYGQLAYVYERVAPHNWNEPSRIALAVGAAAAVESIALYVGWHAHDALLVKAHTTARNLRRASYLIAGLVATVNYAHFAGEHLTPTAAGVMFGLVSLVSPWLWGLHSRRAQRIQLRKERRIDEAGAEFSPERRRHFPFRSWAARRWSIDHGVTDPREAWVGYNAHRLAQAERKAAAKSAHAHTPTAGHAQPDVDGQPIGRPTVTPKRPAPRKPNGKAAQLPRRQPTRRPAQPTPNEPVQPTVVDAPNTVVAEATPTGLAHDSSRALDVSAHLPAHVTDLQRERLADLAREFPGDIPGRDKVMAHMTSAGHLGWTSKGPAQTLIDLLRQHRSAQPTAQPTTEAP